MKMTIFVFFGGYFKNIWNKKANFTCVFGYDLKVTPCQRNRLHHDLKSKVT